MHFCRRFECWLFLCLFKMTNIHTSNVKSELRETNDGDD